MTVLELVGAAASLLAICLLLVSACEKLRSPRRVARTLRALGITNVRPWWLALCAVEFLVASLAAAATSPVVASGAVAGLGVLFAGVGTWALASRRHVECACFGQLGAPKPLGRRQIAALPAWLLLATAVSFWRPENPDQGWVLAGAAFICVLSFHSIRLIRATAQARGNRLAFVTKGVSVYTAPHVVAEPASPGAEQMQHATS